MFVGHYGISYATKPLAPRVPLWVWFIAVQWLDVVWSLLVLLGVEKVRIVPGFTEGSALDLYYMPYTHSLPGSLLLSLAFGAIAATFTPRPRATTILLLAAASFSHWLLDLVVHVPDLPLYDDSAKVGLGLWRHVALSFPLELILLGLGAFLYARAATFANPRGRILYWGFVVFLVVPEAYVTFGPPPASPQGIAVTALILYLVLALLAGAVERSATASTHHGRARPGHPSSARPRAD